MMQRRQTPSKAQMKNRKKDYTPRTSMLNLKRVTVLKYELKELLEDCGLDEQQLSTFLANLVNKASKNSIEDAEDYLDSVVEKGMISIDTANRISRLLNRYKTHR
ncbi:MAG: hypothetical protein QCI38_00935 [Candidatus Thermoplasmatota archaeon]|nr:hypothetical protein [Candidatus Thermoplasmatota archaeon]